MTAVVVLTEDQAAAVRGLTVLEAPAHAGHHALLAGLPAELAVALEGGMP